MAEKIRWGVLSTASIGYRRVVPAIQKGKNCEVAAVASRSLDKAKAYAADRNIPKAYGSYEELLADPTIDAIYNPLPNSEHAAWSIRCAEAGKAVLCEKPLAQNAAEAQQMVDAFAARRVLLVEGFMYRFHPQTIRVKELVAAGGIGDLMVMHAAFTFQIRGDNNIRLNADLAGGSLMDVGCYCVNVMRLMSGTEPIRAQAVAQFGAESGVDERMAGTLLFPGGVLGHFDCGLHSYRTHTYEVRGTNGRIIVEKGFTMEPGDESVIRYWHDDQYEEIKIPAASHFTLMAEDFASALLDHRPPRYPAQDAVNNLIVLDALAASAHA